MWNFIWNLIRGVRNPTITTDNPVPVPMIGENIDRWGWQKLQDPIERTLECEVKTELLYTVNFQDESEVWEHLERKYRKFFPSTIILIGDAYDADDKESIDKDDEEYPDMMAYKKKWGSGPVSSSKHFNNTMASVAGFICEVMGYDHLRRIRVFKDGRNWVGLAYCNEEVKDIDERTTPKSLEDFYVK